VSDRKREGWFIHSGRRRFILLDEKHRLSANNHLSKGDAPTMKNKKSPQTTKKEGQTEADENYPHCIHESAHVVAAWSNGAIISNVTITGPIKIEDPESERSPCYCDLRHPGMVSLEKITQEDVLSRITIDLAPQAVEVKLTGKPSIGSHLDTNKAIRFLTWGSNPDIRRFIESAQRSIDKHPNDFKKAADQFFNESGGPVRSLINCPNTMSAIIMLAKELNKRGRMSGYEAVKLLERSWDGPLPINALPAKEHPAALTGQSLENALSAATRLTKMAFEIIEECNLETERDEKLLETAAVSVLGSVFKLAELSQCHIK